MKSQGSFYGSWFVAALLSIGTSTAGCNNDYEGLKQPDTWAKKGPDSYTYVVQRMCLCEITEPVRVVVEKNRLVSAVGEESGLPWGEEIGETMTELLAFAKTIGERKNADYEAEYDPELGYLVSLRFDESEQVMDDEMQINVSCFAEGTDDSDCPLPTMDASECSSPNTPTTIDTESPKATCGVFEGTTMSLGAISGGNLVCCPPPGTEPDDA
jgi:hypothetical protein